MRRLRIAPEALDRSWAEAELCHAQLGDARRTTRLVRIAARMAMRPSAVLTEVFAKLPAERDAAYDFVENPAVSAAQITEAHHARTATRCCGHAFVFLAVDGSSFHFPHTAEMGRIGTDATGAKGLKSMLALAVDPAGVPLGLLGQAFWARGPKAPTPRARRTVAEKETRYWHEVIAQAETNLDALAPEVRLWPQLDREGDNWSLLLDAVEHAGTRWTTIRACADRRLVEDPDGEDETEPGGHLVAAVQAAPVAATYALEVSGGACRRARTAHLTLRWAEVTRLLRDKRTSRQYPAPVFALLADEEGTTPKGEKPIRWLLLTTYPVVTVRDACLVLFGYSTRWRIEQLHAALKERGCVLEESQLATAANVRRLAAIVLCVGVRLLRLVSLARTQPAAPATIELTARECAALALAFEGTAEEAASLRLDEAVLLLGTLGGHVGDPSKRPIGFKVLGRGLRELRPYVRLLGQRPDLLVGAAAEKPP
jgi:hypothetical protein